MYPSTRPNFFLYKQDENFLLHDFNQQLPVHFLLITLSSQDIRDSKASDSSSLIFVAPFGVEFHFGPNIGMWGVQSVPMERPAHTALLQSIWNHPAEENGQNVKGSCVCGGELILRSAFAFATFGCSHNSCAGELPRSASSHFVHHS